MTDTTKTTTPADVAAKITGTELELTFGNGRVLILQADSVNDSIRTQAMMHGFKQKLVDAAAIARNKETGRSATIDDKFNAVRIIRDRLVSGAWNKPKDEATIGGAGGLLYRALVRLYSAKMTPEAVRDWLAAQDKAAQFKLRQNPRIKAIIDTIKAEDDAAGANDEDDTSDELLAQLDNMGAENDGE